MQNILSYIFLLPLIAALLMLLLPADKSSWFKVGSLLVIMVQFILSVVVLLGFDATFGKDMASSFQFVEKYSWIKMSLGSIGLFEVHYFLGIDGISMPLVVLSSFILLIGVVASWKLTNKVKGYFILYLILSSSIIGCFLALDFFLFYLCFEFMLLPMFFLIGIWGGERRSYASIKFFLYTLVGSLFILIVMIGLYLSVDEGTGHTFSIVSMIDGAYVKDSILDPAADKTIYGWSARGIAFLFVFIGFGIKLPMAPFHTWLPDAHVEAPTPISVVLAGLLLKVGAYGFIRIGYSIFPDQAMLFAGWIGALGTFSIIYGGLNALAQNDMKRMVAYSSVAHMGFILLGLASLQMEGASGAIFHMVSHGLISPALFLIVGVIYDRTHDRTIENFSGLASKLPVYTFFVIIFFFAGLGLPGLSGFVGELLVLMGAYGSDLNIWASLMATLGIAISAAYFLWTIQRMFFGPYFVRDAAWGEKMKDLSIREKLMLIPLALMVVVLGIYPKLLLDISDHTIHLFISNLLP